MNSNQANTGTKKQKATKLASRANVLESVKEDLLSPMSKDFFNQLFKSRAQNKSYSGEIKPGEQVGMKDVFSGNREKEEKLQKQLAMERTLREEERGLFERKMQELGGQLQAIMQEMQAIAQTTPQLAQEIKIAAIQAPVNPGIYHLRFFEKLLDFMQAFRKNANEASHWLHAVNARGKKGGNVWGNNYKKGRGSYLLSSEHYLQRSAG
ncbi:MAG: DUF5660 family protein [Patescibacteria group bacterium]